MAELKPIGVGLNPDDLWRNLFWLRDRITALETQLRAVHALCQELHRHVRALEADEDDAAG